MKFNKIVIEVKGDTVIANKDLPLYLSWKQLNDDKKIIELQKEVIKNKP